MVPDLQSQLAAYFDDDNTFSQSEMDQVVNDFVCAVCHADLQIVYLPNLPRVMIACPEHGNICDVGRVTRNTVSIEMERGHIVYQDVIRNLPDLWGSLIEKEMDQKIALKMIHTHVCAICGSKPILWTGNIPGCPTHSRGRRFFADAPLIKSEKYMYNFQAMKAWERENKIKEGVI